MFQQKPLPSSSMRWRCWLIEGFSFRRCTLHILRENPFLHLLSTKDRSAVCTCMAYKLLYCLLLLFEKLDCAYYIDDKMQETFRFYILVLFYSILRLNLPVWCTNFKYQMWVVSINTQVQNKTPITLKRQTSPIENPWCFPDLERLKPTTNDHFFF